MSNKTNTDAPILADEVLSKSEALILKYKTQIIAVIALIVVIVLGSTIYTKYVAEPKEQEAAASMYFAESLFVAQNFEGALNGDNTNMGFAQIADEYSGTNAGNLANAYAGISLAQLGRYEEAIKYLEEFDGDDQMVAPAAMGTLGSCYAYTGEAIKAADTFVKAAEMANNNTISPNYLLQAGIIYENNGKASKALNLYNEIKENYGASTLAADIDKYINRVK